MPRQSTPATRTGPATPEAGSDPPPDFLSLESALALLPDKASLHTWRNNGIGLLEAYWERADVVRLIEAKGAKRVAIAGASHGLVVEDGLGRLFIETKQGEAP